MDCSGVRGLAVPPCLQLHLLLLVVVHLPRLVLPLPHLIQLKLHLLLLVVVHLPRLGAVGSANLLGLLGCDEVPKVTVNLF